MEKGGKAGIFEGEVENRGGGGRGGERLRRRWREEVEGRGG